MADATMSGYVLGELLGRGGMGAVYAALQPSLGRTVAVKLLHPELASDPCIVDRFRTEALAGSRLSHPNVAGVIDFGVTAEGTPFLVMEHVPGQRLGCILEREGAFETRRACALVCQLLSALDAAHLAGVVHADVKCDNVLVDVGRDGRETATLIDFGIARLVDRPHVDDETGKGVVSGTPEYLAPEVIAGAPPTAASDLYAAGIVLYELLTGETPFHGGRVAAGEGPETGTPPAKLWRVLLTLAAVYDGASEPARAHAAALQARTAAIDARSPVGFDRACTLLQRLTRGIAACQDAHQAGRPTSSSSSTAVSSATFTGLVR